MGLARQEIKILTTDDVINATSPVGGPDEASLVVAPEVCSLQFQYFDGSAWQDSWDSSTPGADGVTPIGPPRAISIRVGLAQPGGGGNQDLKYIRHVVPIPTANGTTQQNTTNQQNANQQSNTGGN
jgi:hypothetical protein